MKRMVGIPTVVLCLAVVTWAWGNEKHIMGTVTAISANSIAVQTVGKESKTITVSVVSSTKFLKSGADASLKDLKVGDRVVIHPKRNGDKLEAVTVKFGRPPHTGMKPMSGNAQHVMGTVAKITDNSIIVRTSANTELTVDVVP